MTHFTVDWYIKNRVVLATIESDFLSIQEIKSINDALVAHLRASDATNLYAILDCRKIDKFQANIALINQTVTFVREPNLRWVIVISDDKMLNLTANIVAQVSHIKLRNSPGVEEGAKFLRSVDPTLTLP